jgi:hypothetical protein
VSKLGTAPDDANREECQANQDAISVAMNDNGEYEISFTPIAGADGEDGLWAFTSTDPGQATLGDVEWLGFFLKTDEVLTNVTWNGTALTQADIDEARSVGATDDKTIIFWVPYEKLPRTVTIGTVDGSKEAVSIKFV